MRRVLTVVAATLLCACGDFVDDDGNTSFRQVAQGLQSLGGRVAEMGEALERDAGVRAVPWEDLVEVLPGDIRDGRRVHDGGDDVTDRNGAGLSVGHRRYLVDGDSVFVGVADLGALRSGARLALRWIGPVLNRDRVEGEVEEIEVDGHPAIRIRDDEGRGVFIALLVEDRFAVASGARGRRHEQLVREGLEGVDYERLEDWADYGMR